VKNTENAANADGGGGGSASAAAAAAVRKAAAAPPASIWGKQVWQAPPGRLKIITHTQDLHYLRFQLLLCFAASLCLATTNSLVIPSALMWQAPPGRLNYTLVVSQSLTGNACATKHSRSIPSLDSFLTSPHLTSPHLT
jgi:hypothetical protein